MARNFLLWQRPSSLLAKVMTALFEKVVMFFSTFFFLLSPDEGEGRGCYMNELNVPDEGEGRGCYMNELNVPYWCEQRIIVRLCGRLLAPCSFVFSEVTLMFFSVLSGFTGCSVGGFCDCPSEASHQRHGRKSRTGSTSSHSAQKGTL